MTIKDQLLGIDAVTNDWAQKDGGKSQIAGDRTKLFVDLLAMKPGAPRVINLFISETPRGEEDAAQGSRVDREFWSVITRGQGLRLNVAESLTQGSGGGRPMYELAEELRDLVRRMLFDPETTERPIYYAGIEPMEMGPEFLTDALIIKFKIGTDIGIVTAEEQ